jgi:hypothetical protein
MADKSSLAAVAQTLKTLNLSNCPALLDVGPLVKLPALEKLSVC